MNARQIARALNGVDWLVKRIDFLDPGSSRTVPSPQASEASFARRLLTEMQELPDSPRSDTDFVSFEDILRWRTEHAYVEAATETKATVLASLLVLESIEFTVTPLPDDVWMFVVKREHEALLSATFASTFADIEGGSSDGD